MTSDSQQSDPLADLKEALGRIPPDKLAVILAELGSGTTTEKATVAWEEAYTTLEHKVEAIKRTIVRISSQAPHILEEELQNFQSWEEANNKKEPAKEPESPQAESSTASTPWGSSTTTSDTGYGSQD